MTDRHDEKKDEGRVGGKGDAPPPTSPIKPDGPGADLLPDVDDNALYRISREVYANVLVRWREQEQGKEKPRDVILAAIDRRLKTVQG